MFFKLQNQKWTKQKKQEKKKKKKKDLFFNNNNNNLQQKATYKQSENLCLTDLFGRIFLFK